MLVLLPPLLIHFAGKLIYLFLSGLAIFGSFLVQQVVDQPLYSFQVNRPREFYDYLIINPFYRHFIRICINLHRLTQFYKFS